MRFKEGAGTAVLLAVVLHLEGAERPFLKWEALPLPQGKTVQSMTIDEYGCPVVLAGQCGFSVMRFSDGWNEIPIPTDPMDESSSLSWPIFGKGHGGVYVVCRSVPQFRTNGVIYRISGNTASRVARIFAYDPDASDFCGLYVSPSGRIFNYDETFLAVFDQQGKRWKRVEGDFAGVQFASFGTNGPTLMYKTDTGRAWTWEEGDSPSEIKIPLASVPPRCKVSACQWGANRILTYLGGEPGMGNLGAVYWDKGTKEISISNNIMNAASGLYLDRGWPVEDGSVWFCAERTKVGKFLLRLDLDGHMTDFPTLRSVTGFRGLVSYSPASGTWIGEPEYGVLSWNDQKTELHNWRRGIVARTINGLVSAPDGTIYASTREGIVYVLCSYQEPHTDSMADWEEFFQTDKALPFQGADRSIWSFPTHPIGTAGRWDGRKWEYLDLPLERGDELDCAVGDDHGRLIFARNNVGCFSHICAIGQPVRKFSSFREAVAAAVKEGSKQFKGTCHLGEEYASLQPPDPLDGIADDKDGLVVPDGNKRYFVLGDDRVELTAAGTPLATCNWQPLGVDPSGDPWFTIKSAYGGPKVISLLHHRGGGPRVDVKSQRVADGRWIEAMLKPSATAIAVYGRADTNSPWRRLNCDSVSRLPVLTPGRQSATVTFFAIDSTGARGVTTEFKAHVYGRLPETQWTIKSQQQVVDDIVWTAPVEGVWTDMSTPRRIEYRINSEVWKAGARVPLVKFDGKKTRIQFRTVEEDVFADPTPLSVEVMVKIDFESSLNRRLKVIMSGSEDASALAIDDLLWISQTARNKLWREATDLSDRIEKAKRLSDTSTVKELIPLYERINAAISHINKIPAR